MGNAKELKWGYIAPTGECVIAPTFDGASDFNEGLAAVKVEWARGYIDREGNFVIKPEYEAAEDFKDGRAIVKIDGEMRCIDRDGNFINDAAISQPEQKFETGYNPQYELHDGLVRFVENQKFGYKDKDGNVIVKPQFFEATDFSEGLAAVKKGKTSLWAYIDTAGKLVIPANFRQAKSFHDGLAAVLMEVE
ncbi:MAG: WG repeat-containing protein [Muribaculaceae bacterium]|nr:WG repeat-containing protein [Muribaculaceae bacterium]